MKFDWHRLFTPTAWVQLYPVNWDYDKTINDLLDNISYIKKEYCVTRINGIPIWTENWPYAYGRTYGFRKGSSPTDFQLPSIKTRKRLRKIIRDYKE